MSELISALILLCGPQGLNGTTIDLSKCHKVYNCRSSKRPMLTNFSDRNDYKYEQILIICNKDRTTTKF